jgi:hypothetical protein
VTPEAFHLWQTMRGPTSHWRQAARATMIAVVREHRDRGELADDAELQKAVDAAYPFGERKYLPYKMWLLERKLFRDACVVPAATPSADEVGVCEVARDLVELGRHDEARKLVEEQAPNRLGRRCPVCAAKIGAPCYAHDALYLIVPHHARLVGHRDAGPLFDARGEVP